MSKKPFETPPGFWERGRLPKAGQVRLLRDLVAPGNVRLYVQEREGRSPSVSITNSETSAGRYVRADIDDMLYHHYLERDIRATQRAARNITVYRITDKGREALAQVDAWDLYHETVQEMASVWLDMARKRVQLAVANQNGAS